MRALLHSSRFRPRAQGGFTLLEVVVVTMLLMLMGGILFGTVASFIRGRSFVLDGRSNQRTATLILSRMNREFLSMVPENLSSEALEQAGEATGNITQQRFVLGSDNSGTKSALDTIRFISEGSGQAVIGGRSNHGRVEIEYRLADSDSQEAESFGEESPGKADQRTYVLVREEQPAGVDNKDVLKARRIVVPLAENVHSLNFRYRLGDRWFDAWRGRQLGFPDVIEVELQLVSERGELETYRTAVTVNTRNSTGSVQSPF